MKRLAYRVQELSDGGLSDDARRRATEIITEAGLDEEASIPGWGGTPRRRVKAALLGTRFVRVRNGRRYEVTVIAFSVWLMSLRYPPGGPEGLPSSHT